MKFLTELFFKSKLIRLFAVISILYFGVYKFDKSDDSLYKKINPDNLSKNFVIARGQTKKIFNAVNDAKRLEGPGDSRGSKKDLGSKVSKSVDSNLRIIVDSIDSIDHNVSNKKSFKLSGVKKRVACNSNVTYDMSIIQKGKTIFEEKNKNLIISSNKNILLERKLSGLFPGNIVSFIIDKDNHFLPPIVRKFYLKYKAVEVRVFVKRSLSNPMLHGNKNSMICN